MSSSDYCYVVGNLAVAVSDHPPVMGLVQGAVIPKSPWITPDEVTGDWEDAAGW